MNQNKYTQKTLNLLSSVKMWESFSSSPSPCSEIQKTSTLREFKLQQQQQQQQLSQYEDWLQSHR